MRHATVGCADEVASGVPEVQLTVHAVKVAEGQVSVRLNT
jgi:hypothetical protein